jgi:hypothetical protein
MAERLIARGAVMRMRVVALRCVRARKLLARYAIDRRLALARIFESFRSTSKFNRAPSRQQYVRSSNFTPEYTDTAYVQASERVLHTKTRF